MPPEAFEFASFIISYWYIPEFYASEVVQEFFHQSKVGVEVRRLVDACSELLKINRNIISKAQLSRLAAHQTTQLNLLQIVPFWMHHWSPFNELSVLQRIHTTDKISGFSTTAGLSSSANNLSITPPFIKHDYIHNQCKRFIYLLMDHLPIHWYPSNPLTVRDPLGRLAGQSLSIPIPCTLQWDIDPFVPNSQAVCSEQVQAYPENHWAHWGRKAKENDDESLPVVFQPTIFRGYHRIWGG